MLGDVHAAEDVFQATFLVLARKAAGLRRPEMLAAWLHGVARRLALKCRAAEGCRRLRETRGLDAAPDRSQPDPLEALSARELLTLLDEEVQRLPEAYRLPLILCCLEGRTQDEAAQILGCTPGSVKGRLERGRARLHARLAKRGLTLSAALAAAEVSRGVMAGVPSLLAGATVRAAMVFAGGQGMATAGLSGKVVTLAEDALRGMVMSQAKIGMVLLLAAGVALAGAGVLAQQVLTPKPPMPPQGGPQPPGGRSSRSRAPTSRHALTVTATRCRPGPSPVWERCASGRRTRMWRSARMAGKSSRLARTSQSVGSTHGLVNSGRHASYRGRTPSPPGCPRVAASS